MTIREMIGQKLVCGLAGETIDNDFLELVREYKIGNVILFERNVKSREQLKTLCEEITRVIKDSIGIEPFIMIDQEGGVVRRLPEDMFNMPGNMAIAATNNPENAKVMAKMTAVELRNTGINFNLAPDLDINSNPANPIIGVRSFGDNPEIVSRFGEKEIEGYEEGGVFSCVKHFPGHGDTDVDSHIGLPCIDKSYEALEQFELIPFKNAVRANVPAVMTTHILFPQIDKDVPATMSKIVIQDILRNKMGFKRLIVSDCMEMDAIKKYYGTVNGVVAAIKAGVDMALISHTPKLVKEAVLALEKSVADGTIKEEQIAESFSRICLEKKKYFANVFTQSYTKAEYDTALEKVYDESIVAVNKNTFLPGENPLFLGCEEYRSNQASNEVMCKTEFAKKMKELYEKGTAMTFSKNPSGEQIDSILAKIKDGCFTSIVIGTYNGHLMQGQMKLVEEISKSFENIAVVALRNPYDLSNLKDNITAIAAWEYSTESILSVFKIINGTRPATGVMPLKI